MLVSSEPIVSERWCALVSSPKSGAVATFLGTTRDNHNGKSVKYLEYEAYLPMADSEMRKICRTVRERWPGVLHVALVHRIGEVPIGETSVGVFVSSPHRVDALSACSWAIDEIKARVPIWKKEYYVDGTSSWKENSECCFASSNQASHHPPSSPPHGSDAHGSHTPHGVAHHHDGRKLGIDGTKQ